VYAETARGTDWKAVTTGVARIGIQLMFENGEDSCVIIAPKRHRTDFAKVMAQIEALRAAGLAE
jgi:hypothetical protein